MPLFIIPQRPLFSGPGGRRPPVTDRPRVAAKTLAAAAGWRVSMYLYGLGWVRLSVGID